MLTDSQRKANRKWRDANLDKICVQVHKGLRQEWKDAAAARGLSLAALIAAAVSEYIVAHPVPVCLIPSVPPKHQQYSISVSQCQEPEKIFLVILKAKNFFPMHSHFLTLSA